MFIHSPELNLDLDSITKVNVIRLSKAVIVTHFIGVKGIDILLKLQPLWPEFHFIEILLTTSDTAYWIT